MDSMINQNIISNNYVSINTEKTNIIPKEKDNDLISIDAQKKDDDNSKTYSEKELEDVLKKINSIFEDKKTHAELSKHEVLNTTIVKIIDDETNKVILEAPPENILDGVAKMCENAGILVDKKV